MRIAVVAPSTPIEPAVAEAVLALAAERFPEAELAFDPQCFLVHNHFAGTDETRAAALVAAANDPAVDAIWFARGGYGSCRIAQEVLAKLGPAAGAKTYLGYSDAGFLLAGLHRAGIGRVAHGPMPGDIKRPGGADAAARSLAWMVRGDPGALEPALGGRPSLAFNITVLSQLLGTPLEPDFSGRVLMLEDVAEYHYRIDRSLFHITSNRSVRRAAGIRLGRCSDIPENDRDFGEDEEAIARHWCAASGIKWLGRADIGHDAENRVVPFG